MDFLQIIMTPFSWLLEVFCRLFDSYGIALILFTVVIKVILFPLNLKGKKGMIKMTLVSGQLKEIQKRCRNDRDRYNREVQKFYAENKVSPTGGCLWTMIPLLILMPLYAIIRRPFRYMMGLSDTAITSVANALNWAGEMGSEYVTSANELTLSSMLNSGNLAAAEAAAGTSLFIINFNFLGLDLSQIPSLNFWSDGVSWGSVGLFLMPIISAALSLLSMVVSQRTNQMNRGQDAAASQSKSMMLISPIISLWIGYTLPAGLCIYWIANSLLMMVQEVLAGKILRKDYQAMQRELEAQARKAKEEEKERRRIAAERKAAAIAAGTYKKGKQNQHANREKGVDLTASREGIRAYARGRAYDPNRYPITPYHDPNDRHKKKAKAQEDPGTLTEEEKAILMENGIPIPEQPKDVPETAQEQPVEVSQGQEQPAQGDQTPDETAGSEEPESKS
ncbi:MAG TPA: YidC/Oxa1 family membrane protein insertase [Candidatus Enterenecus stercoripullorum]|nr:YidC/Oxa1 family membrane protein insertase [Candidatus Enterenecus stercoripullorum]